MINKLFSLFFSILFCGFIFGKSYINGIDVFFNSDLSRYKDFNVGVIVNHTSINANGVSLVKLAKDSLNLKAIFTPEHGLFGTDEAGQEIKDNVFNGVPVYSLYGKNKKPTSLQLKGIDFLLFDMQDIGSRYYTYVSTMTYVMESAADNQIKLIILDRPNPIGRSVEGPVLKNEFKSFVGMHPLPIRHGLTIGELAKTIKGMGWISSEKDLDLEIIKIIGWDGNTIDINPPPSPNIPDLETAIIYNGLCLLEGTNLSEGRGTDSPFKVFGAPWLDSEKIINKILSTEISGVRITKTTFTPESILGKAVYPKYKGELCQGIKIEVTDKNRFYPLRLGVLILKSVYETHPKEFIFFENRFIDKLYGSDDLRNNVISGLSINELLLTWKNESMEFKEISWLYKIYR